MKNLRIDRHNESMLAEHYLQPAFLPPLWRVIFQEAMRGHHLIFPQAIIVLMQEADAFAQASMLPSKSIEEFCVHLFAAPDLTSIRAMIHFLTIDEQKQLFVTYVHLMRSIRDANKQEMN